MGKYTNIINAHHWQMSQYSLKMSKGYTYEVPLNMKIKKGELLLVENKKTGGTDIVMAATNSDIVDDNVLEMIMGGELKVKSKVVGIYRLEKIGDISE